MTESEEIIAEGIRRYPIGTIVKQLWNSGSCYYLKETKVTRHDITYKKDLPDQLWFSLTNICLCVYLNGVWAEKLNNFDEIIKKT